MEDDKKKIPKEAIKEILKDLLIGITSGLIAAEIYYLIKS